MRWLLLNLQITYAKIAVTISVGIIVCALGIKRQFVIIKCVGKVAAVDPLTLVFVGVGTGRIVDNSGGGGGSKSELEEWMKETKETETQVKGVDEIKEIRERINEESNACLLHR